MVGFIADSSNREYFCKTTSLSSSPMLAAEYEGIKEIYNSNSIRVPKPIAISAHDFTSFVIFEKLDLGGSGDGERMGKELCNMHKATSLNNMFGWKINNTIGTTHQPNTWTASWADFWDEYRLGHILRLARRDGAQFPKEAQVRDKVRLILSDHQVVPSLVHGDLWSGNQGHCRNGDPVIFDPAVYVSLVLSR